MLQPKLISRTRRRPSLGMLIMVIALFLSFPAGIVASHQFSDVPNSHTFHGNITNLYNARITTGCGAGIYCPEQAVSRGQMAGFLNRGLGRATSAEGNLQALDTGGDYEIATVEINTGGAPGGTGFVFLTSSAQFRVIGDGYCPCTIGSWISGAGNLVQYTSVPDIDTPYTFIPNGKWESISNNVVIPVNSGTEYTFDLMIEITPTANAVDAFSVVGDDLGDLRSIRLCRRRRSGAPHRRNGAHRPVTPAFGPQAPAQPPGSSKAPYRAEPANRQARSDSRCPHH